MFDSFHEVARWRDTFYNVVVDWWYEHADLRYMFDDTVCDVEEMARRCDAGVDTHFIARVRVFYRGYEMASESLGSCYAQDCDPQEEILENRLGGHFDEMLEQAREQADEELRRLNRHLMRDVANIQAGEG